MGAQIIIEAAEKTQEEAGDGTSTAVVLATEILNKALIHGEYVNKLKLKDKLIEYRDDIDKILKDFSINTTSDQMIQQVATISANNDPEIGEFIASAIKGVGRDGIINVEESNTTQTYIKRVDGMKINSGYISPYFINNEENLTVEYDDVRIAMINEKIFQLKDLMKILQEAKSNGKPLLLIADNIEGEALSALVVNKLRANLQVVAIKTPGIAADKLDNLEDIASIVGGEVISKIKNNKVSDQGIEMLGCAKKVIVSKDSTIIREGEGDIKKLKQRILTIKNQIEKSESDYEKKKHRTRLANLSTSVAILRVGAGTEVEMKERKLRIDDALNATKAALAEGILPGGAIALYIIGKMYQKKQKEQKEEVEVAALRILSLALMSPMQQLLKNSGLPLQHTEQIEMINNDFENIENINLVQGIDMKTGQIVKMVDAGIIDPTKVVRSAVKNAITVAAMLISTSCIIGIDKNALDKQQTMMAPPMI